MSGIVGVELAPDRVRAVALDSWRVTPRKTFETQWDPSRPDELVTRLRQQFGAAGGVALSVGLGFLHVKHAKLPPAPVAERRRILALEPDRFFPVQGGESLVVSLVNEENFAFAVDADLLEQWIGAFEQWAPVENVEPAPVSLARALGKSANGSFAVTAGADERGLVELHAGRVHSARRVPVDADAAAAQPLSSNAGVPGEFLAALGAARGVNAAVDAMLLPDARAGAIRRRRIRRLSLTALVCAGAFALALWALDRSRERTLERITREVASLTPRARGAVELRDRLGAIDRESAAISQLAGQRTNPLLVLAALSEHMPPGATVLNLRASGNEWQIDGTARDAAAIVPLLDRDDRFEDVRFLSASARFREGNRTYETFSIAFRVRPET